MRPAAETQVRSGHPWVFAESIREQNREGLAGELGVIFDKNDQFLAVGLYDPVSPIRVRVIHRGKPTQIHTGWWRERIRESFRLRAGIFDQYTTGGRWINGESDCFPALVLDRYSDVLVIKIYSAIWFSRIEEIVRLVREELAPETLILRLSRNIAEGAKCGGLLDGMALIGSAPAAPVQFLENGLTFEADVLRGQKTGFFLDQRENRRTIEPLSQGKEVLNAFSFSGGFSLYAARGGARSVTDVDVSAHALESARRHFALNSKAVSGCDHRLVQADVFNWIQRQNPARYDIVILDPPSLAKRQADRGAALKAYSALATSGFLLTKPDGITLCCSCSAHVKADEFFGLITSSAQRMNRQFRVWKQTREPIDHHAAFPEAEYLKSIYIQWTS